MAIPDNRASTTSISAGWLNPPAARPVESFHWGPAQLNDPSQGLLVKMWYARIAGDGDTDILLSAPGFPEAVILSRGVEVEEVSLAFDQNGQPVLAFVENTGMAFLWWYDPVEGAYVIDALAADTANPRVTMDDAREFMNGENDVILAYVRAGAVQYRQQRDRFTIERVLTPVASALHHISMNTALRLQWSYTGPGEPAPPFLADVVEDLCLQAGIPPESIDVRELYGDIVHGLKINNDEGLDKPIDWLREIFHFDKAEFDKKIYFPKRGRPVVARIPYNHLVEGNPHALKQVLKDEKKLPRLVNINHLDPDGGFAKNKQTAERRSNLIQTDVKKTIDTQVVLTADQAATSAMVRLKIYHNELIEFEFTTTLMYTELTVTDVVEVEDVNGDWHRMRLVEKNEDGGFIEWQGEQDAGDLVYDSPRAGNSLPPPTSTTPGLVGQTTMDIINASPFRDQDDELGLYIAACGAPGSVWTGYQLLYSLDGGASYSEAFRTEIPSTIGVIDTDLLEETSPEYRADQSVEVTVNFPLSSVSYEQILIGQNKACIGDEIIQYQTAVHLGMDGTQYRYRLSGLVRGRNGTRMEHWPLGTRFVKIDESLIFAQVQRGMIGADVMYKAVTFGLTEDEVSPLAYLFDEPLSQTEWTPVDVTASREGSDVTTTWIGRARFGMDTHPFHSKHFLGYRVKYSDGYTADTTSETHTRGSTPVGATVQVCALNDITGEGPYSEPIAT